MESKSADFKSKDKYILLVHLIKRSSFHLDKANDPSFIYSFVLYQVRQLIRRLSLPAGFCFTALFYFPTLFKYTRHTRNAPIVGDGGRWASFSGQPSATLGHADVVLDL